MARSITFREANDLTEEKLLEMFGPLSSLLHLELPAITAWRVLHKHLWNLDSRSRKVRINMAIHEGHGWMVDPKRGTPDFSMIIVEKMPEPRPLHPD
ncbi:MAG: hypothetical protein WAX89_01850, partial [Alphaproteobacteria bacterium]